MMATPTTAIVAAILGVSAAAAAIFVPEVLPKPQEVACEAATIAVLPRGVQVRINCTSLDGLTLNTEYQPEESVGENG